MRGSRRPTGRESNRCLRGFRWLRGIWLLARSVVGELRFGPGSGSVDLDAPGWGDTGELIAGLSCREREVVQLHYGHDLPVARVAERLGVSVGAVKATLHRARRRMKAASGATGGSGMGTVSVPGWGMTGSHRNDYSAERAGEQYEGKPVVRMWRSSEGTEGFGAMCQFFGAETYRGKRYRFSAAMRTEKAGYAALCFRVDGADTVRSGSRWRSTTWTGALSQGRRTGGATRACSMCLTKQR